jgi:hypothetical protein
MEAIGPVLIVVSIPLIFRWIPPNYFYGFRVPATLGYKSVWYDANALTGRHFFIVGVLMVAIDFAFELTDWPPPTRRAILATISMSGLILIIPLDWRTANRWARERR